MNIALTIWGNRISPVFDSANTWMIVDIKNSKIRNRVYERVETQAFHQILNILEKYKIDILICGAITDDQSKLFEQTGVLLIPFIAGNTDKVIVTLINETHRISEFIMPGMNFDPGSIQIKDFNLYRGKS